MTKNTYNNIKKIMALIVIFDALFLIIIICQYPVIRGDGAVGFGEVIIKGFMMWISIAIFASILTNVRNFFRCKDNFLIYKIVCYTIIIMFFSGLSIWDACEDKEGYCKEWRIRF